MTGALVVAHYRAGRRDEQLLQTVMRRLRAEAETELIVTEAPAELDDVLDRLEGRLLVIAGGDGSLHAALDRLHARGELASTTIGLVPLGTGNDFARGLGLPLDPEEAAARCLSGRPAAMDLLVDDAGGVVVNAVHAGLGAQAAERSQNLKPALGPAAYPLGALLAGALEQTAWLQVEVDGERVHAGATLMVGVLNGPCIGGGTALCSTARPDDGLLDVVVVTATEPAARAAFGAALRKGTHADRADVLVVRGESVSVAGEPVRFDADGELSEPLAARSYTVRAGAWSLVMG